MSPASSSTDPALTMSDGGKIPTLAFGLYKVPTGEEGVKVILDAISAGNRHFDSATIYGNEAEFGLAFKKSKVPREEFFICSKVWNDSQREGPAAVRRVVEKSLRDLCCDYVDIMYVHWPVPGHFIDTYKVLQEMKAEGVIRSLGISNFNIEEYEELINAPGITVKPVVNQMEISPFMYRPSIIQYFQERGVVMVASKALHRASGLEDGVVPSIAAKHNVTPAQVMLRWGIQKGVVVIAKTSNPQRMIENRAVLNFSLTDEDIAELDKLTTSEAIRARDERELQTKTTM